jgi:hypothetical protein
MTRARLGSLLGGLCGVLLALSLLVVESPTRHWALWALCDALCIFAVGVWLRNRWARWGFLIALCFLMLSYVASIEFAPGGCAGSLAGCYNYYIRHDPTLAVAHYFAYLICSHPLDLCCSDHLIRCHKLSMYVQPALSLVAMVVLLKPLASNNRSSGRDAS